MTVPIEKKIKKEELSPEDEAQRYFVSEISVQSLDTRAWVNSPTCAFIVELNFGGLGGLISFKETSHAEASMSNTGT